MSFISFTDSCGTQALGGGDFENTLVGESTNCQSVACGSLARGQEVFE